MNSDNAENKGIVKVSDDALAIFIAKTVLETNGVAGLSGLLPDVLPDVLTKNFHIKDSAHKGVRVSKGDNGYVIDIFVTVEYDVNIPSVAWDLQKNVKRALAAQFGISAATINVRVQGVRLPADYRRN